MSLRRAVRPPRAGGLLRIAALLAPTLLCACSGLLRSNLPPEQVYTLGAPAAGTGPAAAAEAAPAAGAREPAPSLAVARPSAAPGLDTGHIVLLRPDHRMDVYAGSRWPAPVPAMVEALAVQTLRASGAWAVVAGSDSRFPSGYLLEITVRRFEADYSGSDAPPTVTVALDCTVGRRATREVIATYTAAGSAAATADRMSAIVAAFGEATDAALTALAADTLAAVRADAARAPQKEATPAASSSR